MKNTILAAILIGILSSCEVSKEKRVEERIMDCYAITNQDITLKKEIENYENQLIEWKVLKDKSNDSYLSLIKQLAKQNNFEPSYFRPFITSTQLRELDPCFDTINQIITDRYKFDKLDELSKDPNKNTISNISNHMLTILNKNDFHYGFNKMLFFHYLKEANFIGRKTQIKKTANTGDQTEALSIYLDAENKIFINNSQVDHIQLKEKVLNYEIENKWNSTIQINTEKETKYESLHSVELIIKGVIEELREKYALETYKVSLSQLNKSQLEDVHTYYLPYKTQTKTNIMEDK